jgi:hypothetical protein
MKPWITTKIQNHCEQVIEITADEAFYSIEFSFSEADGTHMTNPLFIDKDELPVLIQKLQEMMEYITTK